MKRKQDFRTIMHNAVRMIDTGAFSVLLLVMIRLTISSSENRLYIVPLYASLFFTTHIVRCCFKRLQKNKMETAKDDRQKLLKFFLKSDEEIQKDIRIKSLYIIRRTDPDEGDVIKAIRSGAKFIGVAETKMWMTEIASLIGSDIQFIDLKLRIKDSCRKGDHHISFENLILWVGPEIKYAILGALLYVLSFVVRYKIYYRVFGAISLFFAGIIGVWRGRGRGKFFPEFLDKKGHR